MELRYRYHFFCISSKMSCFHICWNYVRNWLVGDFDGDGAVVAAEDVGVYGGGGDARHKSFGNNEIIDTPPDIFGAGAESVAPPGIGLFVGVQGAEGVDESCIEESPEGLAFAVGKSGVHAVRLGVLKVYLVVGYVKVAADDDGFNGIEAFDVAEKCFLPLHSVIESRKLGLRVGRIDVDEVEFGIFNGYDAPFPIVSFVADAASDSNRPYARVDCRTAVSFFLGVVPYRFVAFESKVELTFAEFGLLEAESVCIEGVKNFFEILFHDGTQAINVPRY